MPQVRRPALGNFDGFFGNKKRKTGFPRFSSLLPSRSGRPPRGVGHASDPSSRRSFRRPCLQFHIRPLGRSVTGRASGSIG